MFDPDKFEGPWPVLTCFPARYIAVTDAAAQRFFRHAPSSSGERPHPSQRTSVIGVANYAAISNSAFLPTRSIISAMSGRSVIWAV